MKKISKDLLTRLAIIIAAGAVTGTTLKALRAREDISLLSAPLASYYAWLWTRKKTAKERVEEATKRLEKSSDNKSALLARGIALGELGKHRESIEDLTRVIEIDPSSEKAYAHRACAKGSLEDNEGAIEDFKQAASLNPSSIDHQRSLGNMQVASQQFEKAIEAYSAALRITESDSESLYMRGISRYYCGDESGSIDDFKSCLLTKNIELKVPSHHMLAQLLEQQEDFNGALSQLMGAVALEPKSASTWQLIGNIQQKRGDSDKAIEAYTKRLELNNQDAAGYALRGDAYLKKGDYELAAGDLSTAIEREKPNLSAELFYARGLAYLKEGEHEAASRDLTICIQQRPNNARYYEIRAEALRQSGDIEGCKKDRNRAKCIGGITKKENGDIEGAIGDWTEAAILGSKEAEKLLEENEHLRKKAEKQGLKRRLLRAVYMEELFLQFGCFSATVCPQEEIEPTKEIYKRLSSYELEELIDDADISQVAFSEDHPQHSIENYIRSYGFDKPWRVEEIMPNIESIIKNEVLLYVTSAVDNQKCEPKKWHKYAESIWGSLMHLLGGSDNMKRIAAQTTEADQALISDLFKAITSKEELSSWQYRVKDAYTRLKKQVLIRTQYEGGTEIDREWNIYSAEADKARHFSDLLNRRVLDLWKHTIWGKGSGKPIQYLRSDDTDGVCASWCSPNVDIEKDRGMESCYYFVSDDGIAVVREFNEYLLLANEQHLHAAALTIIKDVMGEFEFEPVSNAFYEDTLGQELWEKVQSKERKFSPADLVPEYSIEQLRQAVINDYAYLCYQDGGTKPDEKTLEDYKNEVAEMSWEELMRETSVDEDEDPQLKFSLLDYMESWLNRSGYADLKYIQNEDGSTTLSE